MRTAETAAAVALYDDALRRGGSDVWAAGWCHTNPVAQRDANADRLWPDPPGVLSAEMQRSLHHGHLTTKVLKTY
ncbi:hypothetical protein AAFF_G00000250 [Aldrovandia affinis]|uniref:Uncharacterized protein n=1 Tax=Aldrovandia affinis TaxID=143900 RepID=A0AAD7X2B5_9TELE|nr:hypothetical protein AAFF_G00000250 [Aldrovandia affinis]